MTVFGIIVATLLIVALAALLPALLRARPDSNPLAQNIVLRDIRIAELQRDVADHVIDQRDLVAAEDEIARALLEESDPSELTTAGRGKATGRWFLVAVVACVVPAISLTTYFNLGTPQLANGVAAIDPSAEPPIDQATVDAMVAQLEQRLVEHPDSAEGWLLLGRTYMALGRFDEAVPALARARELVGDTPQLLLQYADALAMADGGRIGDEVRALVSRVLELEPENVAALWLAGLGAAEAGERKQALDYLRQAQAISARNGTPKAEVEAAIRELEAVTDPAPDPTNATAAAITVTVGIEASLLARITSQDTLFVFARGQDQQGPPLAVLKTQADNLPRDIVLDDSMSMAPMFKLKAGDMVTVTARISKSGTPQATTGDLEATSKPFVIGERQTVELVINSVVE